MRPFWTWSRSVPESFKRSRSFSLSQKSMTMGFDFADEIVCFQFLSTVANLRPSLGSCLLMSGDSKMGWR